MKLSCHRAFATVAALLVLTSTACASGSASRERLNCDEYDWFVEPGEGQDRQYPVTLIVLDVSDKRETTIAKIRQIIRPYIEAALTEGGVVKLVAASGEGSDVRGTACLDGTRIFLVQRNNGTRLTKDRALATRLITEDVAQFVHALEVKKKGSVTALLGSIPQELGDMRSAFDDGVSTATVVVWSNLLGNTSSSDCLNAQHALATREHATALVRRCLQVGQLSPVEGAELRFVGVGVGAADSPQRLFARHVSEQLCAQLAADTASCA